jgi:hypothetical protein
MASSGAASLRFNATIKDLATLGQQVNSGFLVDFETQIRNGATAMQALQTAGVNALGKIADKLASMAADGLRHSAARLAARVVSSAVSLVVVALGRQRSPHPQPRLRTTRAALSSGQALRLAKVIPALSHSSANIGVDGCRASWLERFSLHGDRN